MKLSGHVPRGNSSRMPFQAKRGIAGRLRKCPGNIMTVPKLVGGIEVRLRPHHYLCIQFFTGHGYDETFTAHMEAVISELKDDSGIIVTEGCDEICSQCPNMTDGRCDDYDRVLYLDTQVMDQTGMDYGKELRWKDVASVVNERILKTDMFETICSECRWFGLCRDMREKR